MKPKRGQVYLFEYDGKDEKLVVTNVTETHVEYAFVDNGEISRHPYLMARELWDFNPDNRRYNGEMEIPEEEEVTL